MKTENKKILFFLFLVITYILQANTEEYKFSHVYFFGFLLATALLYVLKNKCIGALAGITLLLAEEFYNANYKYLTILAFLAICIHKNLMVDINNATEKKKSISAFSFSLIQVLFLATVALFIYDFILLSNSPLVFSAIHLSSIVMIIFILVGLFIYSLFKDKGKQKNHLQLKKQLSSSLRYLYFIDIFSFFSTALFFFTKSSLQISHTVVFFPWYIYICSIFYNEDPHISLLIKDVETILLKISYKNKVKE